MDYGWRWGEKPVVLALLFLLLGLTTVYIIIQYYLLINNRTANISVTLDRTPSSDYFVDTITLIDELYGYRWAWFSEAEEALSNTVVDSTYDDFKRISLHALVSLQDGLGSAALSFSGSEPEVLRTGELMSNGAKLIKIDTNKVMLEKDGHKIWLSIAANCSQQSIASATQLGIGYISAKECAQ